MRRAAVVVQSMSNSDTEVMRFGGYAVRNPVLGSGAGRADRHNRHPSISRLGAFTPTPRTSALDHTATTRANPI